VQFVETQLAGAVGSASARVLVASAVEEESLTPDDVLRILDETSQLRAHSLELEEKSASLERATAELRAANEQLRSLDRLKDDFMSSVTHELRTPLTSIRALAELMRDDPDMPSRAARVNSSASSWAKPSASQAPGEPGAGHGQDRVRPCPVAK
jgi:signal transduction histidine kinase